MTVIRDAVIRIKTEQEKSRLKSPVKEATADQREITRATQESKHAIDEQTHAVKEFGIHSVHAFERAGHGVIQLTRGVALLGAAGEESTKKLLENFVKIEAGVSIAKGAINLSKFAAQFGPVGTAVAAVTAVVVAGTTAYGAYAGAAREAAEAAKKVREENAKLLAESERASREQARRAGVAGRSLELDLGARRTGAAHLDPEQQKRLSEETRHLRERLDQLGGEDLRAAGEVDPSFRRGIHGTPAARKRIEAERRQRLVDEAKFNPERTAHIEDVEREKLQIAERLRAIVEQQAQLEHQRLETLKQSRLDALQPNIFKQLPSGLVDVQKSGIERGFQQGEQERLRRAEKAADDIVDIFQNAARRLLQIENAAGSK